MKSDICVIGAGPAGLIASAFAAQAGAKTVIIERNTSAGRKLLHTGRGRCNITHTGSVEDFVKSCKPFGRFLKHSLYEFSPDDLRDFFEDHGLQTKIEKDGCVFPVTDRATDVARILIDFAKDMSVRFIYGKAVESIEKDHEGFVVSAGSEKVSAWAVIITTGGMSWPFTGSTGDGYRFAKALGHTIVKPRASVVPLLIKEKWPTLLGGVGVPDVIIRGKIENQKILASGPLMFTSSGIGGPSVLDFSRFVTDLLPAYDNPIKITIDMMPQYEPDELDEEIIRLCFQHPRKMLAGVLSEFFSKALIISLFKLIKVPETILAGNLPKLQRKQIVRIIKELPLSIVDTAPIAEAVVTRGGVSLDEVDPETMESKLCPGLFFAGEVLNVDGPCGGYNLQIAFSTGRLAGKMAAKSLSR